MCSRDNLKTHIFSQVAEGIEVTRSLVDAHIHTGMTQYCITVSYKFESCPDCSTVHFSNLGSVDTK